jgi:sucrose-6-phosphate hydrolase SacC (GH32 family)
MECPDLFQIEDIWYLIGGETYYYSLNGPSGPYEKPPQRHINQPFTYAGKRMFDGNRHIWTGWVWDTHDMTDEGFSIFGGTMALPLELYPGSREGELCVKPAREIVQYFSSTLSEVKNISLKKSCPFVLETPKEYMLDMAASIDEGTKLKLEFNKADSGTGYVYIIDAKERLIDTNCPANPHSFGGVPVKRVNVLIDEKSTIKIQAFMRDNIIEFFVNDAYALNRRAYKLEPGQTKVSVEDGSGTLEYLSIKRSR